MAKKKNTIPSEFDDILNSVYANGEEGEGVTNIDDIVEDTQLEDFKKQEPPVKDPEDGNDDPNDKDPNVHDDDSPEPPAQKTEPPVNEPPVEDPNDDTEPTDADIMEAQQVGLLFEAIGNSLGWNMDEIDEDDKPLNTDQLAQYFADVVKQNSVPEYADERIQALDEYVKQGGKFEDFYRIQQQALSLDNIDLEDENNQKAVVREFMQRAGYTDEQINKKISRYEDKQQSREFFNTVTHDIQGLTNIRGISIPKEDRRALFDYIFKVDQNGQSQYQKDFNKNLSKNLIESAYFTMKADSLISTAKRDGESSAAEKLRKLMRHQSKNHSAYNADDKQKSVTDLINGMF